MHPAIAFTHQFSLQLRKETLVRKRQQRKRRAARSECHNGGEQHFDCRVSAVHSAHSELGQEHGTAIRWQQLQITSRPSCL